MFAIFGNNYIKILIYHHVFSLIMFNFHTNLNIYLIQLINKLLLVLLYIALLYIAKILGYLRLYKLFNRILLTNIHLVKNS
jgi:hypothetical protein